MTWHLHIAIFGASQLPYQFKVNEKLKYFISNIFIVEKFKNQLNIYIFLTFFLAFFYWKWQKTDLESAKHDLNFLIFILWWNNARVTFELVLPFCALLSLAIDFLTGFGFNGSNWMIGDIFNFDSTASTFSFESFLTVCFWDTGKSSSDDKSNGMKY